MRSRNQAGDGEALQFDLFAPPPPDTDDEPAVVPEPDADPEPSTAASAPAGAEVEFDEAVEVVAIRGPAPVVPDVVAARRIGWSDLAEVSEPFEELPEPGETADGALSISEFYDRVKFALRREFPADVWVTGEIRKVTVSKGHRYIELADHHAAPGERGGATLDVACWSRDWPMIAAELETVGVELTSGLVVRIRGRASVWEAGARLRFTLTELDVEALVGGIAAARRKLLRALDIEGLLDANRCLPVPLVPMRVGVVTSAGSEAYRDFTGQLQRSGLAFDVRLEASLVQGRDAPPQIAAAIRRLHGFEPDVIVLVRGGGAKGDLVAFDSEDVARAIATSRYPVWTGIGHTGDRSVSDEVAQRSLVTPTACGEAVVAAVDAYLTSIVSRAQVVADRGRQVLDACDRQLSTARAALGNAARHELDRATGAVAMARGRAAHGAKLATERSAGALRLRTQRLGSLTRHSLDTSDQRLAHRRQVLEAYDPTRQLARGWSLTRSASGRIIRSVADVGAGDRVVTELADGTMSSVVGEIMASPISRVRTDRAGQDRTKESQ